MKTFITIIALMFPLISSANSNQCSTSSAAESVEEKLDIKTDVPKFLEGATVIVRLKDGTETKVPAEKFKVVPRKQQFIVTKTKQVDTTICANEKEKNRLSLLAGKGTQEGLDRSNDGTTVTVENKIGAVGGVQYQRVLPYFDDRLSVGAQVQSNKTLLLGVGLDF